jgi:ATP-dependent Clp protease ATP-binding subunit ClpA
MFHSYTQRAVRAVFNARGVASQKGAQALTVDHLVEGILLEDQGMALSITLPTPVPTAKPEHPFFEPETAGAILMTLNQIPAEGPPVATEKDMPVSIALQKVLKAAEDLAKELEHPKIEPLHLLAAVLQDESGQAVTILKQAGIARDQVIDRLKTEKD